MKRRSGRFRSAASVARDAVSVNGVLHPIGRRMGGQSRVRSKTPGLGSDPVSMGAEGETKRKHLLDDQDMVVRRRVHWASLPGRCAPIVGIAVMKIESAIFGTVEVGRAAPYVRYPIVVNGRKTDCAIFFDDEIEQSSSCVSRCKEMLANTDLLDRRARERLRRELDAGNSTVVDFIAFHLEEVADEIREKLGATTLDQDIFMNGLDLVALGFHLHHGDIRLNCDYSIGKELTDELLVVKFSSDEKLTGIAHES